MKNLILFDSDVRDQLLPFTYTRPVGEIRIGILPIREKWEKWLNGKVSYITQEYLSDKFPIHIERENFIINAAILPNKPLCMLIEQLDINEALLWKGDLVAAKFSQEQFSRLMGNEDLEELSGINLEGTEFTHISSLSDLFRFNDQELRNDFQLLTEGRTSQPISATNRVLGEDVFLEEGAVVECATLNATTGPIYVGKNAEIMEGAMVRGGLALCDHSQLKMGARIYGATTIGPWCKVGGEVHNAVFFGYANKAHDGFLGNSVIGEWCNIGADSNNSNLKNNYEEVRLWNFSSGKFEPTGTQFCGLFMGDHSKCGINTMFNTGTVVGVSANIFGDGFPRQFIPSFSWGGANGFTTYKTDKAFETAERVMERRGIKLDAQDRIILLRIFEDSAKYRPWEKKKSS
ncbi:MAG: GlmU family protein [Saprospirales bacterium]|nr:GlmU family protein [Saprospirales bacterium]MBK8490685.1 GlmU family protein [Saprospirales bacterium]